MRASAFFRYDDRLSTPGMNRGSEPFRRLVDCLFNPKVTNPVPYYRSLARMATFTSDVRFLLEPRDPDLFTVFLNVLNHWAAESAVACRDYLLAIAQFDPNLFTTFSQYRLLTDVTTNSLMPASSLGLWTRPSRPPWAAGPSSFAPRWPIGCRPPGSSA
jgi:hypothetical protein